jgi:hypothetical protein
MIVGFMAFLLDRSETAYSIYEIAAPWFGRPL